MRVSGKPIIAVAVSGGADSMALVLRLKEWADKRKSHEILAITVDHGLRPESKDEPHWIRKELEKHGISHVTLTWQGQKPTSRVQERARKARYDLMADYCFKNGILFLAVAHTKNDQFETVVMRERKGSAQKGLAGMSAVKNLQRVVMIRPFLKTQRSEIEVYLKEKKQEWLTDPTNAKDVYERNRIRKENINWKEIEDKIEKYQKLRKKSEEHLRNNLKYKVMDGGILLENPVSIETLGYILQKMGKTDYAPNEGKLSHALEIGTGCTLNHCKIRRRKRGLFIKPETKRMIAICLEDFDVFTYL